MAYSENLVKKVRRLLGDKPGLVEKKMFGGIGFLLHGNMACGVLNDDLIVRVGPEKHEAMLKLPDTRVFDITGKSMKGWVMVAPAGHGTVKNLSAWVARGAAFALSLPPK